MEDTLSEEHADTGKPRVCILYCGGAMSSVGELTSMAAFEAIKRLGTKELGMWCVSALAAGVPKHFRTMQSLEHVLVVDGYPNSCVRKIVEHTGARMEGHINLGKDLKIKKIGPFKPLAFILLKPIIIDIFSRSLAVMKDTILYPVDGHKKCSRAR